jgi:thiamine kinase-like enzyme
MTERSVENALAALQKEHDDLMEEIRDVEQFWTEVNELGRGPKYEEMATRVHQLHTRLKRHFAEEERGGYLAPAIEAAPELTPRAEELKKQHRGFLDELDRFSQQLEDHEAVFHNWEEVHAEFERFLRELNEHETAEMAIVREASA